MIFPEHCKFVAVVNSTEDDWLEKKMYFLTKYLVVFDGGSTSTYEVKTNGRGFIRKITSIKQISSEDETTIYKDEVDLTDRARLIEEADALCGGDINTVVFTGIDRHTTFVHRPDISKITTIEVFDIFPPEPPWLWYNIERLSKIGLFGELQLRFIHRALDLREFEDPDSTVIFPCSTSGLRGDFLDTIEKIENKENVKLVGCEISKKVFEDKFNHKNYNFVNICALNQNFEKPFIVRCCQKERSGLIESSGVQGVVVHWGATPLEIVDAVKLLASKL
ncbi:MAG: hypothetical protein SVM80_07840 [Halobacteriota archaeon]|nr:hypothetical protein [Halobacteriota archaeon]